MTLLNPPGDMTSLNKAITKGYEKLSGKLQLVARYAIDHQDQMAVHTIAVISKNAKVPPSTLIRFAQSFGFDGFSDMQRVFREALLQSNDRYQDRVKLFNQRQSGHLLEDFANANIRALTDLKNLALEGSLKDAVKLMTQASHLHILGLGRSFPVATYLTYALQRSGCPTSSLNGLGGMLMDQARRLRKGDCLIAISFSPYAEETREVLALAEERQVPIVLVTDNKLGPLVQKAEVLLAFKEAELQSFRSLSGSMCVAQVLALSYLKETQVCSE